MARYQVNDYCGTKCDSVILLWNEMDSILLGETAIGRFIHQKHFRIKQHPARWTHSWLSIAIHWKKVSIYFAWQRYYPMIIPGKPSGNSCVFSWNQPAKANRVPLWIISTWCGNWTESNTTNDPRRGTMSTVSDPLGTWPLSQADRSSNGEKSLACCGFKKATKTPWNSVDWHHVRHNASWILSWAFHKLFSQPRLRQIFSLIVLSQCIQYAMGFWNGILSNYPQNWIPTIQIDRTRRRVDGIPHQPSNL